MGAVHRAVCSHCHANRGLSLAHSLAWARRPTLSLPLPLEPICSLPSHMLLMHLLLTHALLILRPTRREHLTRDRALDGGGGGTAPRALDPPHACLLGCSGAAHRARRESEGPVGCGHIAFVSQAIHPRRGRHLRHCCLHRPRPERNQAMGVSTSATKSDWRSRCSCHCKCRACTPC